MLRLSLTLLAASLLAPTLVSQSLFRASLDGTQEVPPVATLAGGWCKATLNTGTGVVTYEVRTFGLSGTAAHFHNSAGGIEVVLAGGPTVWSGSSLPLSPIQIADMQASDWYVNVHTVGNPNGEIRGALLPRPHQFGARLNGAQEVPPVPTAATGTATIVINPNNSVTYSVTVSGMTGTAAHLHHAPFGSGIPGSIEVPLAGGPMVYSGTSLPLSDVQLVELQTRQWYVNVHSAAFPGGQIRGQVVPAGIPNGPSSDPPTGVLTLNATGTPADYGGGFTGTFSIAVSNGAPFSLGYMFVSFSPDALLFKMEPLNVSLGGASIYLLPLNGAGALTASVMTPGLPASFSMFMQFFNLDATAPNGQFRVSNGLEIPFTNF
ncbi:MAG TPA: CHRD domain-containing protein [Planctomycetota bacterium]|nr:CHRD domain-containing protein [Planctomycetota bacterium]